MTYVIIHALAPIFVIMLLGFWAGKAGMVDNKNVSLLNIFVMDFALPATLFSATVQTPWAGIVAQSHDNENRGKSMNNHISHKSPVNKIEYWRDCYFF